MKGSEVGYNTLFCFFVCTFHGCLDRQYVNQPVNQQEKIERVFGIYPREY